MRMPPLSVWFLRAALAHLILAFGLGLYLTLAKLQGWPELVPLHIHVALAGWLLQFAFGVAYWILPRLRVDSPPEARREYDRGRGAWAWAAFVLVNAATPLAVGGAMLGATAASLAALCFVVHAAPRATAPSAT